MSPQKKSEDNKPEHPALAALALVLNDIRNGRVTGKPREMAEQIISMVYEGEAKKWESSDTFWQGGEMQDGGEIDELESRTEGTHRRKVLVFYGEWEKGSPAVKNGHPLTGEVIQGMTDAVTKAGDAFKQMSGVVNQITVTGPAAPPMRDFLDELRARKYKG